MEELIKLWALLKQHFSTNVAVAVLLTSIAFYVKAKVTDFIKTSATKQIAQDDKIKLLERRINKIMGIMFLCPSVKERNKWWLRNDNVNSEPPEGSACRVSCQDPDDGRD